LFFWVGELNWKKAEANPIAALCDQSGEQPSVQLDRTAGAKPHNRWVPPEDKDIETVCRFGHMLPLPMRLNDAPYRLFLLDTSAWDNVLSPQAAREVTKIHAESDYSERAEGGR
jgi:hypothetical protein